VNESFAETNSFECKVYVKGSDGGNLGDVLLYQNDEFKGRTNWDTFSLTDCYKLTNVLVGDRIGAFYPGYDFKEITVNLKGNQEVFLEEHTDHSEPYGFNLVVSFEWEPDVEYLNEFIQGIKYASNYLIDATDGQMYIRRVDLFPNWEHKGEADVLVGDQIADERGIDYWWPHVNNPLIIGNRNIHMPKLFDSFESNGAIPPSHPYNSAWYRTFIHEFGHYLFYLPDEYIDHLTPVEIPIKFLDWYQKGNCDHSLMDNAYTISEFCTPDNHDKPTTGLDRSMWERIQDHYEWVVIPTSVNIGPNNNPENPNKDWDYGSQLEVHLSSTLNMPFFNIEVTANDALVLKGETVDLSITVRNSGWKSGSFKLYGTVKEFKQSTANEIDLINIDPHAFVTLGVDVSLSFTAQVSIPESASTGQYQINVNCVWNTNDESNYYLDDLEWQNIFYVGEPDLMIISPAEGDHANAGSYANPLPLIISMVLVTESSTGDLIMGLTSDDFNVKIGDNPTSFSTIYQFSSWQYKFFIKPPTQQSGDFYDLTIEYSNSGSIIESATEIDAVFYTSDSETNVDVVLVIDRSGSMEGQPFEDAKVAAKQFVGSMRFGDLIGVVSFSDAGETVHEYYLNEILSDSDKGNVQNAIDTIYPDGATAIGEGIQFGYEQLITNSYEGVEINHVVESDHPYSNDYDDEWIISRTDAKQIRVHFERINTEEDYDYLHVYDSNDNLILSYDGSANDVWTPWISGNGIKIRLTTDDSENDYGFYVDRYEYSIQSSIKLTRPVAIVLLSDGGHNEGIHPDVIIPHLVDSGIPLYTIGLGESVDEPLMTDIAFETYGEYYYSPMSLELHELYNRIAGVIHGRSIIGTTSSTISPQESELLYEYVDSSMNSVTFSSIVSGSELGFSLISPSGVHITEENYENHLSVDFSEGELYKAFSIENPEVGLWIMNITGIEVYENEPYSATVSAETQLILAGQTDKLNYMKNEPIYIFGTMFDSDELTSDVFIQANITDPNGFTYNINLYDDGNHGDGASDDGLFSNYLTQAISEGSYIIDIIATGTRSGGETFSRELRNSIYVSGMLYASPISSQKEAYDVPCRQNEIIDLEITFDATDEYLGTISIGDFLSESGTISSRYISPDKSVVNLDDGESDIVKLTIEVPRNKQPGKYTGNLILTSSVSITVPIILDVKEFYVNLSSNSISKSGVEPGDTVIETILMQLAGYGGINNFEVVSTDDISAITTIEYQDTTISENGSISITISINIPDNYEEESVEGTIFVCGDGIESIPLDVSIKMKPKSDEPFYYQLWFFGSLFIVLFVIGIAARRRKRNKSSTPFIIPPELDQIGGEDIPLVQHQSFEPDQFVIPAPYDHRMADDSGTPRSNMCPNCHVSIQEDWSSCPFCGINLPKMENNCSLCGNSMEEGWITCPFCGSSEFTIYRLCSTCGNQQKEGWLSCPFCDLQPSET